jgi:hypothetical protein
MVIRMRKIYRHNMLKTNSCVFGIDWNCFDNGKPVTYYAYIFFAFELPYIIY